MKMTLNGKTLNYKVVDLVERYNFHIKFTSSEFKQKNYKFLKRVCTGGRKAPQYRAPPTAVGHGGRCLPPSLVALDV
jgi:hypothetical protein